MNGISDGFSAQRRGHDETHADQEASMIHILPNSRLQPIETYLLVVKRAIGRTSRYIAAFATWSVVITSALVVHASAQGPQLSYSPWGKACDVNDKRICATSKEGRTSDGKVAVAAELVERPGQKTVLKITLPLGMAIKYGTRVVVDQGQPMAGRYVICRQDGCTADYEVSGELIRKLTKARTLTVQGINGRSGQTTSVDLPLVDFAIAHNGSPNATRQIQSALKLSPTEQEPLTPQLIYSLWTKICLKGQETNAKRVCLTGKDGRLESGVPAVAAVLIEPEGEGKKILRVTFPLGMSIQPGTSVIVDQDLSMTGPYVICVQNGCMADYEATGYLIAKLKRGQGLILQGVNGTGNRIRLAIPLADFIKAYDGPPTDPKEFEAQKKKLEEELQNARR
jgi:invasion protein IalB